LVKFVDLNQHANVIGIAPTGADEQVKALLEALTNS
jgi:uncharacterized protein YuzE